MQFFLFLNDLAGRFPWLDQSARFFYVGAVPLLAALFFGQLMLVSRAQNNTKWRLGLAVGLSLLALAIVGLAIESMARAYGLGTLSPRPWMTRRVAWLVVEPQDNSFPCYEVAIAAIFATAMWVSDRKWGIAGALLTLLLALTRMFCGNNFLADVAVGTMVGSGLCAAFGALCTAEQPFERVAIRNWGAASAVVAVGLGASYVAFAQTPRFVGKLPLGWSSTASAAGKPDDSDRKATRAARAVIGEGEGIAGSAEGISGTSETSTMTGGGAATMAVTAAPGESGEPSAEELALSKRSHLFLPEVEKYLRAHLEPRARPFRLLDIEVAPVKAGDTPYRCAAIRFEINQRVPDLRRQTSEIAASLVKVAFHADSLLQNVDVTAILRGDGAQIDGSALRFAGDEVPVFTASIARQNLSLSEPRWANDPNLGGGLWLRTRSRLWINEKILPASAPKPAPQPTIKPAPPTSKPMVSATPKTISRAAIKIPAAPLPTIPTPARPTPRPTQQINKPVVTSTTLPSPTPIPTQIKPQPSPQPKQFLPRFP